MVSAALGFQQDKIQRKGATIKEQINDVVDRLNDLQQKPNETFLALEVDKNFMLALLDQAECAKYMARFKQEEVKIQAQENHEKRIAELEMKRMEPRNPLLHRPPLQASETLPGGGSSMPGHQPSVTQHFSALPKANTFETVFDSTEISGESTMSLWFAAYIYTYPDVNKSRNSGSTRVNRVAKQQLSSSHCYSHSGEGSVQRCIATTVTQISPELAVFPPLEGPALNIVEVLANMQITTRDRHYR
ncbi:hypothetical protein CTI12_AA554770 [Artemisia annua]|uniref:Uncharacterized protein n=1 Tax=Artemisia annua TaxID=35608 RepID=A0A2U1KXA4_ARTAN|nr:hypothetical protein CTI12_AA554770 [Artemisia annua]